MKVYRFFSIFLLLCAIILGGCAATDSSRQDATDKTVFMSAPSPLSQDVSDEEFEDYGEEAIPYIPDPLESWNRFWFGFNDIFLLNVAKPAYKGYESVMPQTVRQGLSNCGKNLAAPIRIVNRLLQGEFAMAVIEFDRFIVNTILGFGGFACFNDRLTPLVPFEENGADFGSTLRTWGVGEGCYIVWPFFGPSTLRDSLGIVGDCAASPFFWSVDPVGPIDSGVGWSANATFTFNNLGDTIKTYEALVKSAIEPYTSVKEAYITSRRAED